MQPHERDLVKLQRYGRIATATVVGAFALTACGTDDNSTTPGAAASSLASRASSAASSVAASVQSGAPTGGTNAQGLNCPPGGGTLNAEGSSAQGNAMDQWKADFSSACAGATVNYNPTGSGAGIKSFIQGNVPLAGSDSALKPDEATAANDRCKTGKAINLPMVVGPIAVAYNLEGVENLQLKPATIAGIFSGKIKNWNDSAIKADNPNADLPNAPITAFHRSDESGTTENFMKYLAAAAKGSWTYEPSKSWPQEAGGQGAVKSAGVADQVAGTDNSIGYMEQSFAENKDLGITNIGVGSQYVKLTGESAGKAVEAAQQTGSGNDLALKLDYATTEAGAYPLVLVTYEITCEKGLAPDQAALVKSFLTYTASQQGQQAIADQGYAPLPASVQQKVQQAVSTLS